MKTICIIQERINANKVRPRNIMRLSRNRKGICLKKKIRLKNKGTYSKEEEIVEEIKLKLSKKNRSRKRDK